MIAELELHSSHPIAESLLAHFPQNGHDKPAFVSIVETKGLGMEAKDRSGQTGARPQRILREPHANGVHSLYLTRDEELLATIDLPRPPPSRMPDRRSVI
ncbi:MAG: hypothetical protein IPJ00_17125 [Saprospirales bacterium]|nr:hypothetical protein [Saprospirales bacterium]